MQYSQLCDTNLVAYLAYCAVKHAELDGTSGVVCGSGEVEVGGDRVVGVGGNFGALLKCAFGSERPEWLDDGIALVDSGRGSVDGLRLVGCEGVVGGDAVGCTVGTGGFSVRGDEGVVASRFVEVSAVEEVSEVTKELPDVEVVKENVVARDCHARGDNYLRNKASRDKKKRRGEKRRNLGSSWRDGVVVGGVDKSDARKTLEEKWVKENRVAILKLEEQEKRLEARACVGFPTFKVKSPEALVLEEEERLKKLKQNIAKYDADIAYWNKRKQNGAVEKAIALEMEIMDGQLSGKYDVFADRRTIGWAKTVRTNSSTGSSAKKTVWSGSGASKLSDNSESVVSLEKYEASEKERKELLKKSREQEVEIKRVTDVAKQLQRKLRFDREEERKNSLYSAYE